MIAASNLLSLIHIIVYHTSSYVSLTGVKLAAKTGPKAPGKFADMQKDTVEVNNKQQLTTDYSRLYRLFHCRQRPRRLTNT